MESVWTHHDPGLERGGEGAQVSPSLHVPDPQTNEVPIPPPPPMCTPHVDHFRGHSPTVNSPTLF